MRAHSHIYQEMDTMMCVEWSVIWYIYMRSNRIYFFWDKDIGKEAIFFRRRKEAMSEWVNVSVCHGKEGEAIAIIKYTF